MSRGMQPFLFLRYFPLAVPFYREAKCAQSEAFQPVVQAPEVHLLFLVVRFARAKDIKAASPGLYAGQLI